MKITKKTAARMGSKGGLATKERFGKVYYKKLANKRWSKASTAVSNNISSL